jgi:hypothetical protein
VRDLARAAKPGAKQLNNLLASLDKELCVVRDLGTGECTETTTGLRSLMDFFFGTSAAANGFDEYGHYLRTFALVTTCTSITTQVLGECNAEFGDLTEVASASESPEARPAGDRERARERRTQPGTLEPQPDEEPATPLPAPVEPQPETAPEPQADPGELGPAPDATQSEPSLRTGRELLRFLMGNGS